MILSQKIRKLSESISSDLGHFKSLRNYDLAYKFNPDDPLYFYKTFAIRSEDESDFKEWFKNMLFYFKSKSIKYVYKGRKDNIVYIFAFKQNYDTSSIIKSLEKELKAKLEKLTI